MQAPRMIIGWCLGCSQAQATVVLWPTDSSRTLLDSERCKCYHHPICLGQLSKYNPSFVMPISGNCRRCAQLSCCHELPRVSLPELSSGPLLLTKSWQPLLPRDS